MDTEFWKKRWQTEQTGWHASKTNKHLKRFIAELGPNQGGATLVPLCGKSLDMDYLAGQGRKVFGVDVSPIACRAFFLESGRAHSEQEVGEALLFQSDDVTLLCQDLFSVTPDDVPSVEACYDRACLVALAPEQRPRYGAWLASVMPPGANYLLVSVEYPTTEKDGPPFSVPMNEVKDLFEKDFDIEVLYRADIVDDAPKYREWGVTSLIETVYSLRRR